MIHSSTKNRIVAMGILFLLLPLGRPLLPQEDLSLLLPGKGEVPGWSAAAKPQAAAGDDLYLLIDGGADLFLEYGFDRALMAEYRDGKGGVINVEIYRMQDGESAYGIFGFRCGSGGQRVDAGQEAILDEYYLNLWKGDTLVTLVSLDGSPRTRESLLPFARAIASRIPGSAKKPEIARRLELAIPLPGRVVYLKGPIALSNLWPLPGREFPPFDEGAMAKAGEVSFLLLGFSSKSSSQDAFGQLSAILGTVADLRDVSLGPERLAFTDSGGRRVRYLHLGRGLAAVSGPAGADPDADLKKLIDAIISTGE